MLRLARVAVPGAVPRSGPRALACRAPARRSQTRRLPLPPAADPSSAVGAAADAALADPVVTAAFSLATLALGAVTLGVAYLSLASWNDSRIEAEERKRADQADASRAALSLNGGGAKAKVPKRRVKATLTTRGGGKGFSK